MSTSTATRVKKAEDLSEAQLADMGDALRAREELEAKAREAAAKRRSAEADARIAASDAARLEARLAASRRAVEAVESARAALTDEVAELLRVGAGRTPDGMPVAGSDGVSLTLARMSRRGAALVADIEAQLAAARAKAAEVAAFLEKT